MKSEVYRLVAKVIFLSLPLWIFVGFYRFWDYLPLITNSVSLDAKIKHQSKADFSNLQIAAVGSSMTLNNLNSDIVAAACSKQYYNFGAWGLQISHSRKLFDNWISDYHPSNLLLCSSITDFRGTEEIEIPNKLEFFLSEFFPDYFLLKRMNPGNLKEHNRIYEIYQKEKNGYSNLSFDHFGGASLDIPRIAINQNRWNEKFRFPETEIQKQYAELAGFASSLKEKSVEFIFVQAPIRKNYASNNKELLLLQNHFQKCKSIVESKGGVYLNFHKPEMFPDSLFVDQFHLSKKGSEVFTSAVCAELKGIMSQLKK